MMINGKRDFFLVFDSSSWWDDDDSVIRLLHTCSCGLEMERCAMLKEKKTVSAIIIVGNGWSLESLMREDPVALDDD
jgi:hypothetical protein